MESTDTLEYIVVVNGKRQYSIWPAPRAMPAGWSGVDVSGTREECLSWIEENWTDIWPVAHADSDDRAR